jgi:hypothetical protein
MKQLARKQTPLSLVPPADQQSERQPAGGSLDNFFAGWLTSVSSTLSNPDPLKSQSSRRVFGKLPLTSTDVTRVNRATVRESTDHRHWPPDVVRTFMRADVIKRKNQ